MKSLYISYDGMTDSLGQSQVIPYLRGLVREGHEVHVLSCEKKANYKALRDEIGAELINCGIHWHPIMYTKTPPVLSTFYDVMRLKKVAASLEKKLSFDVVHCRSYIAALVGQHLKGVFGVKFLFDIRGFWADERVDGGLWDLSSFVYKKIYAFFKKKEKSFFLDADAIVTLTGASKDYIEKEFQHSANIHVIPCAVDLNHFQPQEKIIREKYRGFLGLKDEFTLLYLGSLGTWYMLPEMMNFFRVLKQFRPESKFVLITADHPARIMQEAERLALNKEDITVKSVKRSEVPSYISVADLSVFFIKPCFSKMASSPTKHGELLASNIPVICNDIGDLKEIVGSQEAGMIVNDFSEQSFSKALAEFFERKSDGNLRKTAQLYYSLEKGISTYNLIYRELKK